MQRELNLSISDRKQLAIIRARLAEAEDAMALISEPAKKSFAHVNVPSGTLPYCLKWGAKACENLIAMSDAKQETPIWVNKLQLGKSMKLPPGQVQKLIELNIFPVWKRKGLCLFDLNECRQSYEAYTTLKAK